MSTIKKTATKIHQKTGGKFQTFKNINKIKTVNDEYSESEMIHGKTKPLNRPSTLTLSKFKAGLPTGSRVTGIEVLYKHEKAKYNNQLPNLGAPTITIYNGDKPLTFPKTGKNLTKKGKAPIEKTDKNKIVEESVKFTGSWEYNVINSDNFKVEIDYPENLNEQEGYLRIYYVQIKVTYTAPSYGLSMSKSGSMVNGEEVTVNLICSNPNKVNYAPAVTITAPAGFSLKSKTTNGTVVTVNNRTWIWTPKFKGRLSAGNDVLTMVFDTDVTFSLGAETYTGTFEATENYKNRTKSVTCIIRKPDPAEDESIDDDTPGDDSHMDDDSSQGASDETIYSIKGEWSPVNTVELPSEYFDGHTDITFRIDVDGADFVLWWNNGTTGQTVGPAGATHTVTGNQSKFPYNVFSYKLNVNTVGRFKVTVKYNFTGNIYVDNWIFLKSFYISVMPSSIPTSAPHMTLLELSDEELKRLGHNIPYILQDYMKLESQEAYIRDWSKNFKLAVFNNCIEANVTVTETTDPETGEIIETVTDTTDYDNLTPDEIVLNAEYWSPYIGNEALTDFVNVECPFVYNENYPLYVIITGDYPEGDPVNNSVLFSEPCIIENNEDYAGWETNGIFPISIDDLVLNDNTAELTLSDLDNSNKVILYDLPLEDGYGTNTDIAIRGIEVIGEIQKTDDLVLTCILRNGKQESRERSIILDDADLNIDDNNKFHIGGVGDLWGFSTLDIVNLEDWDVEIQAKNTLTNKEAYLNMGSLEIIIYVEDVEHQNIKCCIEGEDLSYYGIFINDLDIPEGLKTETKFLDVDGTDTNDAYRMNIREKEITIEFDIGNCDLEGSTLSLRELVKLLTNKRDESDRPIPKKIEFSHYPDVYWEYILEDPLDTSVEISSYHVKAKLTIPAGTSYDKEPTKTSNTGYVSGIAYINPIITLTPLSDDVIGLNETVSKQSFHMGYSGEWAGKIIELDCGNKIATLKDEADDETGTDISYTVDWCSDWFRLIGEYSFETVGCIIRTISYQERW